jgi:multiple sugar transport system substrate-binding protein
LREKNVKSKVIGAVSLAVAAVGLFATAAPAFAQQKTITVWWGKGFYRSEDDALLETIK